MEFYWYIAVFSSALLVLSVLLSVIGFDIDSFDFDFGGDAFSINSLVAFFTITGWTGYLAQRYTSFTPTMTLVVSVSFGILAYVGSIFLLKRLKNLESSGNLSLANAIGKKAKVHVQIPGKKSGTGQVQILLQGRLKTLNAITFSDTIDSGLQVLVYDVDGNNLVVEPYLEDI